MSALQILIVDDESLARARLRTLLAECQQPQAVAAGEADSAAQALALAQRQQFDAALLDVHMPGADGLKLAEALGELPQPPLVVFVTAYAEHAVRAFELEAVDYLTKPVRLPRLQAALQKVERLLTTKWAREPDTDDGDWLVISERGRVVRVPVAEVLYLKAELKYITVRTAEATLLLDGSLNQLEDKFPDRFLRIHRNALVTRNAIRELLHHHSAKEGETWSVRLTGVEETLVVSRRQVPAVREAVGE
jgi:two-component system response regulator AlgR